jgi:hypothetical protein
LHVEQVAAGAKLDVACAVSATLGIYNNVPCTPARGPVNVLLLDALNTPTINQADINRQVQQYLKRMQPGTSLAVFALNSRLQMLSGFTTDASQLIKVAQSKAAGPQVSVAMANGMAASLRTMADRTPEQSSQLSRGSTAPGCDGSRSTVCWTPNPTHDACAAATGSIP